jgi:Skp family chaperone for outer membrane proteins
LALSASAAAQNLPAGIAYFSPSRAFSASSDGKSAQARLAAVQAEKAAQVETRRRALAAQQEEFAKSAAGLSESVKAQQTQAIRRFEIDLERFIQDAQAEVMGI